MILEEKFEFTFSAKKRLLITLLVGVVLSVLGYFMSHSGDEHHSDSHDHMERMENDYEGKPNKVESGDSHIGGDHEKVASHHGSSIPIKRLLSNLWINNVFFSGLALIGVFFFSVQYAAQVGWSVGIKRIPLAYGNWLPIAFVLMLVVFMVGKYDIFHWTHADLYEVEGGDKIVQNKAPYFFWPLEGGSFPLFWVGRLVIFFGIWYFFFKRLQHIAFSEDIEGGITKWYQMRKISAIFLVIFAISSSIAAWDWIMSIDVHWFSTMFGWYAFSSWWVAGLALTLFIVVMLKDKGYLSVVNENHIHDLAKFVFAFSIFWTYIWFSQFLLIYYAHLPEETVYFVERWKDDHYAPIFFINLILNFFLPFFVLMTRDAKRYSRILKVVCPAVVFGHWLDFYMMVSPGTVGNNGGIGLIEIGLILVYASAFLYVTFNALSKAPLYPKNHPMLRESLHHHI